MRRLLLLGLALVLLLSAGVALAAGEGGGAPIFGGGAPILGGGAPILGGGGFEISRWVIAGSGGRSELNQFALTGTIGEAVVGAGSGGSFDVCSGFWAGPCGWEPALKEFHIYLPLVLRGYP